MNGNDAGDDDDDNNYDDTDGNIAANKNINGSITR